MDLTEQHEENAKEDVEADAPPLEVVQMPATLTDRLLMRVRQLRLEDDRRDGFLRDYPDGTAGRRFKGPTLEQDQEATREAAARWKDAMRNANPSWRHLLELELARALELRDEQALEMRLLKVAAVAIAWAEGINMRADRRRIDNEAALRKKLRVVALDEHRQMVLRDATPVPAPAETKRSWLMRLLAWFRRR
jgi:hypothetical protein